MAIKTVCVTFVRTVYGWNEYKVDTAVKWNGKKWDEMTEEEKLELCQDGRLDMIGGYDTESTENLVYILQECAEENK